jgi:hypothetical protein
MDRRARTSRATTERTRRRVVVLALFAAFAGGGWLGCNQLFGIEDGNLVDPPDAEAGASDGTLEAAPGDADASTPADGDATAHDGDADADAGTRPDVADGDIVCADTVCPSDTQCCFTRPAFTPYCRKDGEADCNITCRNSGDCDLFGVGSVCCVSFATVNDYGATCQYGCAVPFCLDAGDCTSGLACNAQSCEGGIVFHVCGDAAPTCF